MRICKARGAGRWAWWVATGALFLGACAHLGAPGPVVADRPGYTDTPTALPARAIQLEAGVTDDQTGDDFERTTTVTAGEVLARFGVGARTELRLFGNSYDLRSGGGSPTVRGLEDVKFGAKVNLRSKPDSVHSWAPNVALLAATTSPTGSNAFSAGVAQAEVKLAANWTTASPFSLYTNVAYSSTYADFTRQGKAWTSAAGWWALNPRVSLFGEGYFVELAGDQNGSFGGGDLDGGVTYLVNDRLQLDARVGHGVLGFASNERFIGVGIARRW
jgi:outer membrane putative beta-barrel porin/alpha-amylase